MTDPPAAISRVLRRLFADPAGLLGRLGGRVMADANAEAYRRAISVLGVDADDRVLDVGCGPGQGLALLAARAERGLVAGVDPSEVMVAQARDRNAAAVGAGAIEVRQASAGALPYADAAFTKVCAVHTVRLWPSIDEGLREVHRVLTPGGRVLVAVRMDDGRGRRLHHGEARDGDLTALAEALGRCGFADVVVGRHDLGGQTLATLRGVR